jgi:S-adenosylmethionine decarboxylase
MDGLHLTADLSGCDASLAAMTEPAALRTLCVEAVKQARLIAVGELFHAFPPPGGVTGVVLLAESHLAVHTWPELAAVTLDVYVCNYGGDNSQRAHALLDALVAAFSARDVQRQSLQRGVKQRQPVAWWFVVPGWLVEVIQHLFSSADASASTKRLSSSSIRHSTEPVGKQCSATNRTGLANED